MEIDASAVTDPAPARSLRTLFGRSATYAAGGLAYKAVALISVPILARLLSPADLGLLDLAAVMAGALSIVALLGTENAVARHQPGDALPARLLGSALAAVAVATGAGVALVVVASGPLAMLLTGSAESWPIITAAAIYAASLVSVTTALNQVRMIERAGRYAIYGFLIVTGEMLAATGLALVGAPVPLMVLGWTAASAIGAAYVLWRWLPPVAWPERVRVRRLLRFGLPLVPAAIAWVGGDLLVRAVIARDADLAALGQYGVAHRVVSVMSLGVSGFALAWHPFLYRAQPSEVMASARRAMVQLSAGLGIVALCLSALAPELVTIVGGAPYRAGAHAVPSLSAGMLAFGWFALSAAVLGVAYRTRALAAACVAGMAVQAVVAIVSVPSLGISGAGIASAAGYLVAAGWALGWLELSGGGAPLSVRWLAIGTIALATLAVLGTLSAAPVAARMAVAAAAAVALLGIGLTSDRLTVRSA